MQILSSAQNPQIKELVRLQTSRRERRERGLFVLEGARISMEAADSGVVIEKFFFSPKGAQRYPQVVAHLTEVAGEIYQISDQLAQKIGDSVNPQGIFCLCRCLDNLFTADKIKGDGHYLAVYGLQDPGNLGTIIRSCDAFGADGLILSEDCPDLYSPKVLRSSMGGFFRLPVYLTADMGRTVGILREGGIPVYAAALSPDSSSVLQTDLSGGACVMIGNEGSGLPQEMIDCCSGSLIIPMTPQAESLNAAVAASVILWEMFRGGQH